MTSKSASKSAQKGSPAKNPVAAIDVAAPVADTQTAATAVTENLSEGAERGMALKLRELVSRVSETTGGKKKDVKEIVEATLAELGSALGKGEELNLPGVGKVRVARSIDKDGRTMMTLKVRGVGAAGKKDPQDALADADEAV